MVASPTGFGYQSGANTATFSAIRTGPGNSPFRRGDAFEVIWSVRYSCLVNGQAAGCQIVNYTYRYINQASGNPELAAGPRHAVGVVDAGLHTLTH